MQYNSGTDAIIADIDFMCDTNSTSYPIEAKTRNANRWAYQAQLAFIDGNSRWQMDDSNLATLPHLTTTIVNGQGDYTLPSEFLRLERVEVKDSAGDYKLLLPLDHRDIKTGYTEFEETDGLPKYYDVVGNSINLFPKPSTTDVTTTEGLRIHILREIDIFTTSDTTQELGFPEPFHRIVSLGASFDYLMSRGDYDKANGYRQEIEVLMEKARNWSAHMQGDEHIRIRPAHRTSSYL